MSDNRFDTSKPVFKSSKSKQNKIKVDDRFKDILTNEKFIAEPGQIDKYGRKLKKKKSSSKELAEFYEIEDEVTDEAPVESLKTNKLVSKQQSTKSASKSGTGVKIEDRLDYLTKLARGEIEESSDEEIDDKRYEYEDDEDENLDNDNDLNASEKVTLGPLALENPDEVEEGEATQRIALQNCDWENLKAIDILVVLQSFCPTGKSVKSVTVYLSDFGKLKLEEESRYGVRGIWKRSKTSTTADDDNEGDEDEDDDDGDVDENDDSNDDDDDEKSPKNKGDFNRRRGQVGIVMHDELVAKGVAKYDKSDIEEAVGNREAGDIQDGVDLVALRRYELSKLRYYFAIAECDSVQTADAIYNEVDGLEMENSAMVFDCRFVPDDVSFKGREVREKCDSRGLSLDRYTPPDFIIKALQHTKVECTWDAGERHREKVLTNISMWKQLNESDLQQYVATTDSDDDDENNQGRRRIHDDDSDDSDGDRKGRRKYSKKAARIRKLLLGEDADVDDEDEDDEDDDEEDIDVDDDDRVNASSDDEDDEDDDEDDEDDDEEEEEEDDEGEDDNDDGNDDGNNDMDHYIDEPKSRVKVKENSTDFFVEADTEADVAASKAVKSDKSKQSKQQASIKPKNKRSHAVKDAEEDEVVEEGWDMAENDDDEGEIDREMTYTYKPEDDPSDKPLNERTPLDVAMQKIAEKRRARKLGKKERLAELQQQEQARKAKSKSDRKYKKAASNAAGDDTEGDDEYNMRSLEKEEKLKSKLKVGKKNETLNKELKKLSAKNKGSVDFEMNFSDDRFAAVVDGDARYAIDPTSTLFKQTAGMKSILEEQRKRKRDNDPDFAVPLNTNTTNNKNANKNTAVVKSTEDSEQMDKESNIIASTGGNAKALANKLKKKFNK